MIVYHGSNSNFKKLRIAKDLVRCESTKTNEGMGIYFSTDVNVAKSYGKYLYTLEINDKYFKDFRKKNICRTYIMKVSQKIYKETKVDILSYINLEQVSDSMYFGGVSISFIGRELYLLLDSNERFYRLPKYKIDRIYQMLRVADKNPPVAYMFNYHIKNIGVIKKIDDDIVRIVNKENSY